MAGTRNSQTNAASPVAAPVDAWFSAAGAAAEQRTEIFRTRRGQAWDPAAVTPGPTPAQRKAARFAEFTRLRTEEGLTIAQASRQMGINPETGRRYEAERLRTAGDGPAGGAP